MRRVLLVVLIAVSVGGCGVAARIDSRTNYQASTVAYKQCLAANPASPRNCEGLRLAMEADERQYNALSAGINPGSQSTANVTLLSR